MILRYAIRRDAMRWYATPGAMCCEAALYVCAVPEYLEMAMRDYLAILRDVTRSHAISCAVTRRVPPKGLYSLWLRTHSVWSTVLRCSAQSRLLYRSRFGSGLSLPALSLFILGPLLARVCLLLIYCTVTVL